MYGGSVLDMLRLFSDNVRSERSGDLDNGLNYRARAPKQPLKGTVPRQKFSRNRVISENRVFPLPILLLLLPHHTINRTPLAPISNNRPKGRNLRPDERGFLLGLSTADITPSKIFHQYRVPESTTRSTITLTSQRDNQVTQPRSGRLTKLSIRDYRHLIRIARANPRIKYRDLLERSGLSYSKSTVYRALKAYGLTN